MIDEVKNVVSPTINLMKELNAQIKSGNVDHDLLLKIATTMKVGGMKLEKLLKDKKASINGGVTKPELVEEEEE